MELLECKHLCKDIVKDKKYKIYYYPYNLEKLYNAHQYTIKKAIKVSKLIYEN